ncbi:putative protein phosphatase 2C 11 [Vitis vinifera]|uniref:PPM-type phosphatase domain-containing protein n=1 Tax=Vitis vinifera TaxID=29760 RepID=A0A438CCY7_VITVI|nr:putative protein phosphatase 2C 11 [Vitis vinifera]
MQTGTASSPPPPTLSLSLNGSSHSSFPCFTPLISHLDSRLNPRRLRQECHPATLSIFVTVTHFRSPDYALPGDNGGWCNSFLVPTSTLSRPCFLRPPGTRPELPPLPSVGYPAKGVAACRVGSTIPLSTDHEPDRSDERQRIEDAGGFVIWAGIWRRFKKKKMMVFIIIASDGLWDVFPNKEVVMEIKVLGLPMMTIDMGLSWSPSPGL